MKIKICELRQVIREVLEEIGGPSGGLRRVRGPGGRQVKLGKIEEENRELSPAEADHLFPGAVEAWTEVVPDMYPDFPFHDPFSIRKGTLWFKIGDKLKVSFKDLPQVELAVWDPVREDWFPLEN